MYRYDEFDHRLVRERVAQFRGQVERRLSGALTEDQFKPLRLMNGLYLQLHAYMLRVAVPYGTLSPRQLRMLAHVARTYDRGYGHFTTRQNIQYNWIQLHQAPDVLEDLAKVEMHAMQTSGNCIRNVTADQYAGVAAEEIEDPRPWCEIVRQWSTLHPEFSFLPRKFKIAVTGSSCDRAAIRVHDIGLVIVRSGGATAFDVHVGGGQGRTPMIAKMIRSALPATSLLAYLEAIMRVYNRFGRRDNLFKSRIKILVHEIGAEEMTRQVEEEFAQTCKTGALALPKEESDRIGAYFAPPPWEDLKDRDAAAMDAAGGEAFSLWRRTNTAAHKVPGYVIVNVSLKQPGIAPGDATAEQMEAVADLAERHAFGEVRVTHEQNLTLASVRQSELADVWRALDAQGLATPNIGLITDQIVCPGLDYCNLANARSIPVAHRITRRFADLKRQNDIGELKIKISGCINACGHHHVGHIGILGVDKKGKELYQVSLGGAADETASLGRIVGPAFSEDDIVDAVETVVNTYLKVRRNGERFLDAYRRVGPAPFKDALYASDQA